MLRRNFTKERLKESTGQFLKVDLPESLDVVASHKSGARLVYHISGVDATASQVGLVPLGPSSLILLSRPSLFLAMGESGEAQIIPSTQETARQRKTLFLASAMPCL